MKVNQRQPRKWQSDHLDKAQLHFGKGGKVFLSQAVTGAGKTTFGALLASLLLRSGSISRVAVLCPSIEIAAGWRDKFAGFGIVATTENVEADDVVAVVFTYQGGAKAIGTSSTLLILDEIHHAEREASWGFLADRVAGESRYVLALTGTPWMTRGRIAILDKFKYYKDGRIELEGRSDGAVYSYADDLREDNANRATVPLKCHFFESLAVESPSENSDSKAPVRYHLKTVTDENIKEIIADGPHHDQPLGPHVTIKDNLLSGNKMAMDLLLAAVNKRYEMENSDTYRKKKKPIGLVTCRSIKEARWVAQFLEESYGEKCEVIVSEDEKSAKRLREISAGINQPSWVISVGMVSEGVDIQNIKVIAFLNAITTVLFLIQLIGRALRRISYVVDGKEQYIDRSLTETVAHLFAPAHPAIVKVATELERIGNQAIQDRTSGGDPKEPVAERPKKDFDVTGGEVTTFYRGIKMTLRAAKLMEAINSDPEAMAYLGPLWSDMIHQWIESGRESDALKEMESRKDQFGVQMGATDRFSDVLNYDTESRLLRLQAENMVQRIRFSHEAFASLPDSVAYKEIRVCICERAFGHFKKIAKMSLDEKRKFVAAGNSILEEGRRDAA
jgi:superfamily II DNA or RNA helicase